MMTYQEAIEFLFPLHRFGMRPGLKNIQALCDALGNPERKLGKIVHVAGTNGKGSVSAMLASMCQESGAKVGLYTSPHLVDFSERIRINGVQIPKDKVAQYCEMLKPVVEEIQATFFETTTAMAFKYFADEGVTVSVIETGMGGRLDATNVVASNYSVITNVSLEHTETLGHSTAEIAAEKAAIIKQKSVVLTGARDLDALEVITRAARERRTKIKIVPALVDYKIVSQNIGRLSLHLSTKRRSYHGLKVPLTGAYQAENVAMAVSTAEEIGLSEQIIRDGLLNIHRNTGMRGRLDVIAEQPMILLDVSHNPAGIKAMVDTISFYRKNFNRVWTVFGVMSDKDAPAILAELQRVSDAIIAPTLKTERALSVEAVSAHCQSRELTCVMCANTREAISEAKNRASEQDLILITGSFYLAGEALEVFE
ncbi:MAG: bifunctional folylpolyglutamate synthase/dihydrofolate synthase [Chlorobiales bacterium]|nr:bifunctional folylpolyglutamate synthase/dihydrofolate synthase [Chlorobiales bacterium]